MKLSGALVRLEGVRCCGGYYMALCPAHDDSNASLSICEVEDGKARLHCFAGCSSRAIVAALSDRSRCFVFGTSGGSPKLPAEMGAAKRIEYAQRIWREARSAAGTLVEVYLTTRAVTMPVPTSLRFHPSLRHSTGVIFPAMVASIQNCSGQIVAIHRTFLRNDGSGKACVEPQKMTLGPARGGAVRLAEAEETICVTEGIETGLSIQQSAQLATWVVLGTSNLARVELPTQVRAVIIAADHDIPGLRAAVEARDHFMRLGLRAQIVSPEVGDFNDLLINKAVVED